MNKLTKESLKTIMETKVNCCNKEDMQSVLKLFGLQVKEYTSSGDQVHFEIHHRLTYVINVSASNQRIVSYGNEWINWGENGSGFAIPTDDISFMIATVLSLVIPQLHIDFEGPEYDPRKDWEYSGMEEMQELLSYAQELLLTKKGKKKSKR